MSVLVTGSVAVDHIMIFEDLFTNHFVSDKLEKLNVAFHVPELSKLYGGTGANIAFNLCRLGIDPILLAAVGSDLGSYEKWMDESGIRRDHLLVLEDQYTSACFITTDAAQNQIISFHPGAMDRAHEARVADVKEDFSVGIVSPNGKQAMIEYARDLKVRGVHCVMDPGQGLPILEAEELLETLTGASVYIVNEYEWELTCQKTGLDEDAIAERVGALIVTRGEEGSTLRRGGHEAGLNMTSDRTEVGVVKAEAVVDPTGCGDSYRAGLLYAIVNDLPLETGVRLGSLMGSLKVARQGPQSIDLDLEAIRDRYQSEFGESL
ncbi:MAG: carbohydrate kinase family protein [Myxococcales bacterium]|nr:carbohydrate kinase family protein [Myxococcales bacterium]HIK84393.1 carbohydrate kinase family protein [Myxococcales bacterium]